MEEKDFNAIDERIAEAKAELPAEQVPRDMMSSVIEQNARSTSNVKETIDLLSTKKALEQDGTVDTLVAEKTAELKNDAEAKRVQAETARIQQEVEKVKQEGEKEIAELTKVKNKLQAEVEQMAKEADKAEAYFEANKDILKCAGITTKKTLPVMKAWLWVASLVFIIIQIIKLPITIVGSLVEGVINIIGDVCGAVKNNAIRVTVSVFVIAVLIAAFVGIAFGGKQIITLLQR
nr:MAG TPA: vesicle-associated membrane protein 2 [Caudoviricetes sp.]